MPKYKYIISIHALVKRATVKPPVIKTISSDFNPRPREEGDIKGFVSIKHFNYFNPRPREEGDVKPPVIKTISSDFNPLPRE